MDKLLILKLSSGNFWHRRNDLPLTDRNISDFEVSIDEFFVIVEKDGSKSWKYEIENVTIKVGAGAIETFIDREDLRNRLVALEYTPYVGGGGSNIDLQTLATLTNSATEKTTLVDDDTIVGNDSVTPFELIKFTLLNVWNYLKTKVEALSSEQIIISTSTATADSTWHNRTIVFTSNCVVTISGTLPKDFVFNGIRLTGVTLTFGITAPKVWLDTAPTTISGTRSTFNIIQQGTTNNVMYNG